MTAISSSAGTISPDLGSQVGDALAVVVARDARLPAGWDDVVTAAGGAVVVVGSGTEEAAHRLAEAGTARLVRWTESGRAFEPGRLATGLAPLIATVPLVVLPASADGRDLAPRLAACAHRPLVARAVSAVVAPGGGVRAVATRMDDRLLVPVELDGPVVVTVVAGAPLPAAPDDGVASAGVASDGANSEPPDIEPLGALTVTVDEHARPAASPDAELLGLVEPDPHTMDLADATRVFSGGAGLAVGLDDRSATEVFDVLGEVAATLGGSAGATRVATDAGWTGYERQIGTTGVAIDPVLYVAFGVSGAAQHVGGIGNPRHVVSVNIDPSAPMTAMADLGLVTDARALLESLAVRLGVRPASAVAVADGADQPSGMGRG